MDRQRLRDRFNTMDGSELASVLETVEDRWGVRFGNECEMNTQNVYSTISHYFFTSEQDTQDMIARRHEDAVFEVGEIHRRFRDLGEMDDTVNNRCNRILELLFYADLVLKGVIRMKTAAKISYTSLVNNDVGIIRFRPMLADDLSPQQNLIMFLLKQLAIGNFRKYQDKVMKAIHTSDGEFTTAWEEHCTLEEFIHKSICKEIHFEQWQTITSGKDVDRRVAEYLQKHNDHEFPSIEKNRHAFAFKNGVYFCDDLDENGEWCDNFYPYKGEKKPPGNLVSCKYTDLDLECFDIKDPMQIPTPILDSLVTYQKFSPEEIHWMYVFLGRLIFDVGEKDGWQVVPFFKGQAGSGKSTIINYVAKNFYDPSDVATVSNNTEKQFGLANLVESFLIVGPEIKKDWKLEQADFQTMVSGEAMSVAQKFKSAKQVDWKSPMVFAGNELMSWDDNSGSLQRRIVIFQFNEIVRNGDTMLGKKLKQEFPNILVKSARAYMAQAKAKGSQDVWRSLPKRFTDYKNAMAESTNSLISFLRSERCKLGDGHYCPRKDFITALRSHAGEHGYKLPKWHLDYWSGPFTAHGVVMKEAKEEWPIGSGRLSKKWYVYGVRLEDDSFAFDEHADL